MKISLLSLVLLAAMLTSFTTSVFAQASGDEAAIRQVLDATQLAFDKRDIKEFGSHFSQSPKLYFLVGSPEGMVVMIHGYDNLVKMVGGRLKEIANQAPAKHTLSQYVASINGQTAWVTLVQTDEMPDGGKVSISQLSVLEKQGSIWKIVAQTSQSCSEGNLVEIK